MRSLFLFIAFLCSAYANAGEPLIVGEYQWYLSESGQQYNLRHKDKWLGAYVVAGECAGKYYKLENSSTGKLSDIPSEAPCEIPVPNYGVDSERLGNRPSYRINGKEVSRQEVIDKFTGGTLKDDSKLLRLTVIGSKEQQAQVKKDLDTNPELQLYKDKLLYKGYEKDHWAVKCGFDTMGNPSIYLQDPAGKVLHKQLDYADGAPGLSNALRKVDPNYNPNLDPDKRRPDLLPDLSSIPLPLLLAAGLGIYLVFFNKPQPPPTAAAHS